MQTLPQYREKERLLKVIAPVVGPIGISGCVSVTSSLPLFLAFDLA